MKPELRRIEATLNHLNPDAAASKQIVSHSQAYSFNLLSTPTLHSRPTTAETVQPFPAQVNCPQTPNLPKLKMPSFSSHRHVSNPALAMGLLKEMEGTVTGWQTELQQVMLQIQAVYLEGPIVEGWLESHSSEAQPTASATLRHAEIDRLMDYVQEICKPHAADAVDEASRTDYRLCGLDADGQLWSRPCPAEQIPQVSMAIARYQKLRQLLGRKQYLETRLSQLAKTLIALHETLQEQ